MPQICLAFDFGLRRIGVALGNTASGQARPLATVHNPRSGQIDWAGISAVVRDWAPDRLVVGLPGDADGDDGPLSARARRFSRQLQGRYALPVSLVPEHLSTVEAARQGPPGAAGLDSLAAAVILQSWLDSHSTETPEP